ncbi:hypothetical protein G7046_g2712 [Stylonectria norvegica]|nr:hypothetical protein G7046_g2712 [Stylonectria norvegica]
MLALGRLAGPAPQPWPCGRGRDRMGRLHPACESTAAAKREQPIAGPEHKRQSRGEARGEDDMVEEVEVEVEVESAAWHREWVRIRAAAATGKVDNDEESVWHSGALRTTKPPKTVGGLDKSLRSQGRNQERGWGDPSCEENGDARTLQLRAVQHLKTATRK